MDSEPTSKITLTDFRKRIQDAIGQVVCCPFLRDDVRPFVCRGNPLDCKVFIVGYNPRTPMPGKSFWKDFWDDNVGFNYERWNEAYKRARESTGEEEELSATRQNINRIVEALKRYSCKCCVLETNLYPIATKDEEELRKGFRNHVYRESTAVLKALLQCIPPIVIIAHGEKACREMIGTQTTPQNAVVIPSPHLSLSRAIFKKFPDYLGRATAQILETHGQAKARE